MSRGGGPEHDVDGGSLPVLLGVHELQHFFGGLHESIHVSRFEVRCDLENELGIQRLQSHCCYFLHEMVFGAARWTTIYCQPPKNNFYMGAI